MDFKLTYLLTYRYIDIHVHNIVHTGYNPVNIKLGLQYLGNVQMYLLHASFHISGSLAQALKPLQT